LFLYFYFCAHLPPSTSSSISFSNHPRMNVFIEWMCFEKKLFRLYNAENILIFCELSRYFLLFILRKWPVFEWMLWWFVLKENSCRVMLVAVFVCYFYVLRKLVSFW
jgi:hypothetical protein